MLPDNANGHDGSFVHYILTFWNILMGYLVAFWCASIMLPNTYTDFERSMVSSLEAHLNGPRSCLSTCWHLQASYLDILKCVNVLIGHFLMYFHHASPHLPWFWNKHGKHLQNMINCYLWGLQGNHLEILTAGVSNPMPKELFLGIKGTEFSR